MAFGQLLFSKIIARNAMMATMEVITSYETTLEKVENFMDNAAGKGK